MTCDLPRVLRIKFEFCRELRHLFARTGLYHNEAGVCGPLTESTNG
jgi:hypothetical protein